MKERYLAILLLLLLLIYNSQGVLYGEGGVFSQSCLILIHLIGCVYFIKTLLSTYKKDLFYKAWTVLLLLNVFGLILTGNIGNPIHFSMFKGILMSLLVFYPFYYFSSKNLIKFKDLILFLFVLIPLTVLQYSLSREQILQERISDNTNVVNNVAYDFVWLLPFVFFIKKNKLVSILLTLIIVFFVIQGAKRGAMFTAAIGVVSYMYYSLKTVSKKHRIRGYIGGFVGLLLIGYYSFNFITQNEFLIERLEQMEGGASSGRDIIYSNIFNAWYSSESFFNLLFGYGFAGSVNLSGTGNLAHNDWLELLSNFGLLGVTIYVILFYSGFKKTFYAQWNIDKKILFGLIISMWFLTTLFSMGYTTDGGYLKAILLAYLLGGKSKSI